MRGSAPGMVSQHRREFQVGLDDVMPDTSMLDKVNLARVKKVVSESAGPGPAQLLHLQQAHRKRPAPLSLGLDLGGGAVSGQDDALTFLWSPTNLAALGGGLSPSSATLQLFSPSPLASRAFPWDSLEDTVSPRRAHGQHGQAAAAAQHGHGHAQQQQQQQPPPTQHQAQQHVQQQQHGQEAWRDVHHGLQQELSAAENEADALRVKVLALHEAQHSLQMQMHYGGFAPQQHSQQQLVQQHHSHSQQHLQLHPAQLQQLQQQLPQLPMPQLPMQLLQLHGQDTAAAAATAGRKRRAVEITGTPAQQLKKERTALEHGDPNGPCMSPSLNGERLAKAALGQLQVMVTKHRVDPVVAGATKLAGKRWTAKQDEQLREAVSEYGCTHWKQIAQRVEGRNHVQCLQRWKKVLQPGLIKGMWSLEEDDMLLALMAEKGGAKCWSKISDRIPGRTAKQCRERWYLNLDPEINRNPWTKQEDDVLVSMHAEMGNKWAHIRAFLPGRTENAVKSRFKSLVRAIRRKAKTPPPSKTTASA